VDMAEFSNVVDFAKRSAKFTLAGLNQLLWPAVCVNCRATVVESDNGLCSNCWGELMLCTGGDYCPRCGTDAGKYAILPTGCPKCQDRKFYFDAIARGGVYQGALRRMILSFKSADRTELDRLLAFLADSALQGSVFASQIDTFVPVPLHWIRRLIRGYNQSLLMARKLTPADKPVNTDLVRIRRTKPQPGLSPTKRAANVAGAFAVRKGHNFAGKNICLVDDIKTTGATLNECARVVKQAGAAKVFAVVLAVAGQDKVS